MAAQRPLRVVQMIASAGPGGAETFALRLIKALHKRPQEIQQLVLVRPQSWLEARLQEAGVPLATLPYGGWFDWRSRWLAGGMVSAFRADVVMSWMSRATRFVPAGPWATVGRLGGFYNLKYYKNRVRELVTNTDEIRDYCVTHGWASEHVQTIGNFIPAPAADFKQAREITRERLRLEANDVMLLMAGRLHKVKGVDVALQALSRLPTNMVLVLLGVGPARRQLQQLAERLGVKDRVRWVGWAESVAPFAAAAEVWLAPSRHEPLGNTVLDAWAHEVPVVASAVGGMAHLIEDQVNGLLVPPNDAVALATTIELVMADSSLAQRLVHNGLATLQQDFSEERIVRDYLDFYAQLRVAG